MFHPYPCNIQSIELPRQFTYPFHYQPHRLSVLAAQEVQQYLLTQTEWQEELSKGKMFGVLVVRDPQGKIGFLAAFSGILAGKNQHPYFVTPVFDLLQPKGFFKLEEKKISDINQRIAQLEVQPEYLVAKQELTRRKEEAQTTLADAKQKLKAAKKLRDRLRQEVNSEQLAALEGQLIRESQHQKAAYKRLEKQWEELIAQQTLVVTAYETQIADWKKERKQRSAALQQKLFQQFDLLNARGERRNLYDIFEQTVHKTPPAGAGECAAPKLLQYAYLNGYKPLAMAEFWWGASPKAEIRVHGQFYPSCKGKCEPILGHMLQGLDVETNPMLLKHEQAAHLQLEIIYEDEWLVAVDKPAGMPSVPGKIASVSVESLMQARHPQCDGPLIVHRLDMDTSGLLLLAKTKSVHQTLQMYFEKQHIQKRYIALLDGTVASEKGLINLPICPNLMDRPRQMVSKEYGKVTITRYQVLERGPGNTRIALYPLTGRTHQLRVHAAHSQGLNCPIKGDNLYGTPADRLYLHAELLEFTHPVTGKMMRIEAPAPF